ncbi:MAG: imidazole glycerol phosphate synthase subunit HisH [Alphaproteobacteria bacterium]|nr:imidazole glycerol phosphate synthase subunit HisH [Alphaproteobacteria bacterium]
MRVAIVEYGAGNLASVQGAVVAAGGEPFLAVTPEQVATAERLILPGVGAAGTALAELRRRGLEDALADAALRRGRPFLGICLGMQLLAERLHEFGEHRGLGWIPGAVLDLRELTAGAAGAAAPRVPHMGWNTATVRQYAAFFGPSGGTRHYYFCHSYALTGAGDAVIADTPFGGTTVAAAVLRGNVAGTQFHPEKSQTNGRRLLEAFLHWAP